MSSLIEELKWRGLLQDMTPGLEDELKKGSIVGYIGYDPTAPSLTIGNLVTIMLLKHLQLKGHRPIVLMGGATGKIGDPSGKDKERQLLSYQQLQANIDKQAAQFTKFLDFDGPNAAVVVNNADFYDGMDIFTFLRDIGKNITISYMLSKESVKNRLEKGISFTEFSYQLIQGYDFQHLYEKENCVLQMGGSDQWGNIMTGTHFVGKNGGKAFGLTCPLLTKADGKKFGKSEEGNVWLAPEMTSPYKFYQFWQGSGIVDDDLPKLFKTFSLKSREEIEEVLAMDDPIAKRKILAEELTVRIHSQEAYESVLKATQIVFNKKLKKDFLEGLSEQDFDMLSNELPSAQIAKAAFDEDSNVLKLLVGNHDSLKSNGDARRAIKGSALSVNCEKVTSHELVLTNDDLIQGKYLFVQNGKKNKFLLVVE
ncbi:MAG: tyrosine--tRNA ligase [Aureispira sp.]|nr:tyrosine--tRNA ligase [Aureispira sp.]